MGNPGLVSAQSEIGWVGGTVYDFAEIEEADGPVSHEFTFKNNSESPFSIVYVIPSCGCITVEYTKSVIAPGETAKVNVKYNPEGKSGVFKHKVSVYTDSPSGINTLFVKGKINPVQESQKENN